MKRPLVPLAGQACIKLGTKGEGGPSPALAELLITEPGVGYRLAAKE